MNNKKSIHFIGIGGSGMSGVAIIAKSQGYEISGCDLNINTPYIDELKNSGVKIFQNQDEKHINNIDIIAATPAVFFQNENHPEIILAKKEKKLITWQKFLGKYLQKNKEVICIAGTHGKSTTTAMLALLFEREKLDPSVMIGANIKEWNANFRIGKSKIFITEADEFFDNFLNYKPSVIILNNIEYDHPDYFKDRKQLFKSFNKFIENLQGKKILIYNDDDPGIKKLFRIIGKNKLKKLNLYPYSTKNAKIKLGKTETHFEFQDTNYKLKVPGKYNVSNALGVIVLGKLFNIPTKRIRESLYKFNSIGRRLELISNKDGVKIYDDYAHHPTAISKTLSALRQKYPKEKILAIIEPHTFSRTKALLPLYENAFTGADEVIIAPIFRSRDTENFGVSGKSIVEISKHHDISYIGNFSEITTLVKKTTKPGDVIIVMGAGDSYKLAYEITEKSKTI